MDHTVRRRMRGRPRKLDSPAPEPPSVRRSLRPRNLKCVLNLDDYFEDDDDLFEDDFEDHSRKKKKLDHLLNLHRYSHDSKKKHRRTRQVDLGYDSAEISDDDRRPVKKGKVYETEEEEDVYREESTCNEDEEDEVRYGKPDCTETEQGSPPGTPLPDKKALEMILDKLQKKDIYGVYAEPADPEELPDYYDRIKNPMDFATLRKKLSNGAYATLEQFEGDVFLICLNAMQYNEPGTIYHKQARSIRELAKKKFEKIRLRAESTEKETMPEKMISTITKKQISESVSRVLNDPVGSDFSSGTTRSAPVDVPIHDENCRQTHSILLSAPIDVPIPEDNRRSTYSTSLACPAPSSESLFATSEEESKHLIPVGLYSDHAYARSLSRFAATLGSVAWKVAANRIEQALPADVKFGRGWVEEYEPLPTSFRLRHCVVKEPDFFAKVQPPVDPWRTQDIPFLSDSSKESLERNSQFAVSDGIRSPMAPCTTASLPVKEHVARLNHSEQKPSFSRGANSCGSVNFNHQHQNLQPRTAVKSDQRFPKQVELNGPPDFNKNMAESFQHRKSSMDPVMEASRVMVINSGSTSFTTSRSFNKLDTNEIGGRLAHRNFLNAESLEHKQISKGPNMEASRLMDFNSGNTSFPPTRSLKQLDSNGFGGGLADGKLVNAQSLEHRQISKAPDTKASRLTDFSSGNASFSPCRSLKQPDSNGIAGGLADGRFVNAESLEHRHISKGPDREAPRLMDFNSRNASFPRSTSFKQLDSNGISGGLADGRFVNPETLEHRQISKGQDREASNLMDTSFPPSTSFKQLDCNGIAGGLANGKFVHSASFEHRQIHKGPDMEAARSVDFNSKDTSFPPYRSFKQPDSYGIVGGLADGKSVHAGSSEHRQIRKGPDMEATRLVDFITKNTGFPPSRSFKQLNSNGVIERFADGKSGTTVACLPSNMANPSNRNFEQGQGLSDPVQLMRMMAEKAQSQRQYSNETLATPKVFLSEPSSSSMLEAPGPFSMRVVDSQNQQIVYPQFTGAELSRSQMLPWWNLGPQTLPVQKPKSFQPDLNVDFQSSGSPGRPPSSVSMDSQQPDLALQL